LTSCFSSNEIEQLPNFSKHSYLPDVKFFGQRDVTHLSSQKPKGRFNQNRYRKDAYFEQRLRNLNEKEQKTVVESLLSKIISPAFQNFTFIASVQSPLQHILRCLIENNFSISPALILKANSIMLIPVPQYNISFISLTHFLEGGFYDHKLQFGLSQELKYFPVGLSHLHFSEMNLPTAPDIEAYIDMSDSEQIISDKRRYHAKISEEPWNFKSALRDVALAELTVHVETSIALLKASFSLQLECLEVFGQSDLLEPKHMPFLHLFHYVSIGSYIHQTFRLYQVSS
jgi:hypothetical protein